MAYCSRTQLETHFGEDTILQLCDDESQGSVNPNVQGRIDAAIVQAGQDIDGYIQAHFLVPLTGTIPPLIQSCAIDIAIFYLYRRRRAAFGMPEDVADAYRMRLTQLQRINEGRLQLGAEPAPAASSYEVGTSEGPAQVFTAQTRTAGSGSLGSLKDF